jgi:hypothetical protein
VGAVGAGARWSWLRVAGSVAAAGAGCGAAAGGLAWMAGGAMGVRGLARFGPVWWQVGGAAGGWIIGVGVPVGVLWWGVRMFRGADARGGADGGGTSSAVPAPKRAVEPEDAYDFLPADADPAVPEAPDVPATRDARDAVRAARDVPEVPAAPHALSTPDVPPAPGAQAAPGVPPAPQAPTVPPQPANPGDAPPG